MLVIPTLASALQPTAEIDEFFQSLVETLAHGRIDKPPVLTYGLADVRDEDPASEEMSVTVLEDPLDLLNRSNRAPRTGRESDEPNRLLIEAVRETQHIDEVLHDPRAGAVVLGNHGENTVGGEDRFLEWFECGWFLAIARAVKEFDGEFGEIEDLGLLTELTQALGGEPRDLCGVALRTIRA